MKKHVFAILIAAAVMPLAGCLGDLFQPKEDPTLFYLFRPENSAAETRAKNAAKIDINMMPFSLPAYMGRNQIVSLADEGKIEISEFNRWGELPVAGFVRVLTANIETANTNIDVYNYPSVSFNTSTPNMRLFVNDFIGKIDGWVTLKGSWQIASTDMKRNVEAKFSIRKKSDGTYASYVAAMNSALAELGTQMAAGVAKFEESKNGK